jgi:protein-disulfide isomerase
MVNHEADGWVDERIASLACAGELIPDAVKALAGLRARNRARVAAMRRCILTVAAAVGVAAILIVAPASRACAEQPGPCVRRVWGIVAPENSVAPALATNFRESGSDSAPLSIEIYLDLDCPHCEAFVRDVAPLLAEQYVRTGKVRLLYRDYPLPTHPFAKLAARYADAAGQLGYYDIAVKQIFETPQAWDQNGDIDAQLALVLPPKVMKKLRERLNSDSGIDDMISADMASGQRDHLNRVPFAVIVYKGQRIPITDSPLSFEALKSRIDELTETKK